MQLKKSRISSRPSEETRSRRKIPPIFTWKVIPSCRQDENAFVDGFDGNGRRPGDSDRLREIEERFRALSEHSTDPISEIGQDRRLIWVSPGFTKAFGYQPEEVIGMDAMQHIHPDDLTRVRGIHKNASVGQAVSQLSFRFRHKDGSWRWLELTGCPYLSSSGEIRAILINRDVTDRVNAEAELQEQLAAESRIEELSRYFLTIGIEDFERGIQRGLAAASTLAGADRAQFFAFDLEVGSVGEYFQWNADGRTPKAWNYSDERLTRYRWSGAKLVNGEIIAAPDVADMPGEAAEERDSLLAGGVKSYLAIPIIHGETTIGFLDFFCEQAARSWSEQEIARLALLTDVFASALRRHRAEVRRSETEYRLHTLAEHTSDSICELAVDGRILYASPSFCEISGYTPEELNTMKAGELVHPGDRSIIQPENIERLIAENGTATVRSKILHRDGGWRSLEATARPFHTPTGESRFAVVIRDITGRQQAQDELQQQLVLEQRLARLAREFLDRGADEIDDGIRHALEAAGRLAGADRCWLIANDGVAGPEHFEWCADSISPRSYPLGLSDREEQAWVFRQLASGEPVRIPRTWELPDEVRAVRDPLVEDGVRSFLAIPIRSQESLIGVLGFHALQKERDWTEHEVNLFQLVSGIFTSALRRKRAEVDLRESEERFRALAEHAKDPICEIDRNGTILYASPSLTDLVGHESDEISELSLDQLIHPDDLDSMRREYAVAKSSGGHLDTLLYRARHKNGDWVVLEGTARRFESASGEARIVAVVRDVTERQRAQRALERQLDLETRIAALSRRFLAVATSEIDQTIRESLADLAVLAESDRSWLVSFDPKTETILDVFEWHREHTAFSENDTLDIDANHFRWTSRWLLNGRIIHLPNTSALLAKAVEERKSFEERGIRSFLGIPLHSGSQAVGILGFETVGRQKSWSTETITLLRLVGEIFVSAIQRKTIEADLRDSQQQLMQAQKMEAVGTLAGGIAHDFNNQLTVMLGNARYVMRHVEDDPELKDALADLNRAAEHCAQLTRSLLAFSRRSSVSPRPLDVGEVVTQVAELLRPLIPSSIAFEVEPPRDEAFVEADPTQLQQVLVNLAINARDSMPDGGRLLISTENRHIDRASAARLGLRKPGEYVEIAVIDTGQGIDEATKKRIFEPFFTTKPLGQGTGLGLATAYGIVTDCGGVIQVDSTVNAGTDFRVLLPVSTGDDDDDRVEQKPRISQGFGRVLIVEDERAVQRFMSTALKRNGFDVVQADNGVTALELAAAHPCEFDAVVTDINMPEMSGTELARRIAVRSPELPILFVSGSSRPLLEATGDDVPLENFLQKPFGEEEIVDALRRLIATARAG